MLKDRYHASIRDRFPCVSSLIIRYCLVFSSDSSAVSLGQVCLIISTWHVYVAAWHLRWFETAYHTVHGCINYVWRHYVPPFTCQQPHITIHFCIVFLGESSAACVSGTGMLIVSSAVQLTWPTSSRPTYQYPTYQQRASLNKTTTMDIDTSTCKKTENITAVQKE